MYLTNPKDPKTKDGETPTLDMRIKADKASRTLTISDGGIGMTKDDLINSLGSLGTSGFRDLRVSKLFWFNYIFPYKLLKSHDFIFPHRTDEGVGIQHSLIIFHLILVIFWVFGFFFGDAWVFSPISKNGKLEIVLRN